LLSGCQEKPIDDIFKTTDGEFASRMGKFVAAYPEEPFHFIYQKSIPDEPNLKRETHTIELITRDESIYRVEYFDANPDSIHGKTKRELNDHLMMFTNNFFQAKKYEIDYFDDIKLQNFDGVTFTFKPSQQLRFIKPKHRIKGKVILRDYRIYFVYYVGKLNRASKLFLKSFRFTK
jgi:hypothetical protein